MKNYVDDRWSLLCFLHYLSGQGKECMRQCSALNFIGYLKTVEVLIIFMGDCCIFAAN